MKELAAFMVTASAEERANLFRMLLPAIRHRMIIGIIGSLRGRLNDNRKQLRVISLPSGVVHGTVPIAVLLGLRCTPISAQHRIAALVFQRWISWRSALIRGAKAAH